MKKNTSANENRFSLFRRDPSRRAHLVQHSTMGSATQQFQNYQHWILEDGIKILSPSSLLLGCLLAFDAFVLYDDLRHAYESCNSAMLNAEAVRINWTIDGRIDARQLSVMSIIALTRAERYAKFETSCEELSNAYATTQGGATAIENSGQLLRRLLENSTAWLQSVLPPVLFGHVSGIARMAAVPTSTFARLESKLALRVPQPVDAIATDTSKVLYSRAFDAALLGKSVSTMGSGKFIRKIEDRLTPPSTGSVPAKMKYVRDALTKLSSEIEHMDEVSALIFIFALQLVENGTRGKEKLAPATPLQYVRSFASDLCTLMDGKRLFNISEEEYRKVFVALLPPGQPVPSYRQAGLKAFHLFLRSWWNVPKLPTDVFGVESSTPVRANLIWPHETALIQQWLVTLKEARLALKISCAIAIASSAMIRVRELFLLRILNVQIESSRIVIEIAREIRDGKEKTIEGRRRIFITDPGAIAVINAWLARRKVEAKNDTTEYLFGDSDAPGSLQFVGKLYYWTNLLPKCVSGDPSVSLYTLRHTVASLQFAAILADSSEQEVNPLDELANQAGHVGGHITAINYGHLFEAGMRQALDLPIAMTTISYKSAALWSGTSEQNLRQRVCRSDEAESNPSFKHWFTPRDPIDLRSFKTATASHAMELPVSPLPPTFAAGVNVDQVAGIFADAINDLSTQEIAFRRDLSESIVTRALTILGRFADRHGFAQALQPDFVSLGFLALKDPSGALLGMATDFSTLSQQRWKSLLAAIQREHAPTRELAIEYWERAFSGIHLAVRPGAGWEAMLKLLHSSAINASQFVVRAPKGTRTSPTLPLASDDADTTFALDSAQAAARKVFGRSFTEFEHSNRGGRATIWLVISSDPAFVFKNGTANSMAGFHSVMLSAYVWQLLVTEENSKNGK